MLELLRRLLCWLVCWLGFHDFHVVDATFAFGAVGEVETVECRRCGYRSTRAGPKQ